MIAKLYYKDGKYYCGNCYLKVIPKVEGDITVFCPFCGYEFVNIEEIMIKIFKEREEIENESRTSIRGQT